MLKISPNIKVLMPLTRRYSSVANILEELERPYKELWRFEKELFAPRKKAKRRKKAR